MFGQNNDIRGRSLEAINHELESEIQRFNEREKAEAQAKQNQKPNPSVKTIATLLVTQIMGK